LVTKYLLRRYPKNETLRQKWLDSVNEKWFCPSKSSVVCSKHFLDTDYLTNIWGNLCLKPEAIPKRVLSVSRCLLNGKNLQFTIK